MKTTQRELAEQEALRTEREQRVAQMLPTGTAEHNRDLQETKITFASGAKLVIDWSVFEKGEVNCLWLGLPLPTELAGALGTWNFKTLFLSQESDDDVQDAIHEILTLKDNRFPGQNIYHYPTQREALLSHAWTEGETKAVDIYRAWLRNAHTQVFDTPESAFMDTSERDALVQKIPGFTPKKVMNRAKMEQLGLDPDKVAKQVEMALRKARREKENQK